MGLHTATAEILEDDRICSAVCKALDMNLSRRYIQNRYGVSKRQVDHIIRIYRNNHDKQPGTFYGKEENGGQERCRTEARMA